MLEERGKCKWSRMAEMGSKRGCGGEGDGRLEMVSKREMLERGGIGWLKSVHRYTAMRGEGTLRDDFRDVEVES